ncbi:Uncharacterized protein FWK35_00011239 [Aphis craccivora]|uniref:Uncharacterized protein n=1 Tax=Aphis craccivora TaxID=307492 RepID=A0A6G0ZJU5_APHCR|nr:Uncharacterized protein FWK35_00011239 [Aphis craccivora]
MLPEKGAKLDTSLTGVWLADNDCWDGPLPTADSGVSEAPVAVTSVFLVVLVIIVLDGLASTGATSLMTPVFCPNRRPDHPGHRELINLPVVHLSATAYSPNPKVWLISRLPCTIYRAFPYPQPGDAPDGMRMHTGGFP